MPNVQRRLLFWYAETLLGLDVAHGRRGCLPLLYSLIAFIQIHLRFVVLHYMALTTSL